MTDARSLAVQSVLYGNSPADIVRAAESTANAADIARTEGRISDWALLLGDCSPEPVLGDEDIAAISAAVEAAGGRLSYSVFGENLGSAGGQNRLAQLDGSELMLILNPDALVAPDTILVLADALVEGVGVVEARQVPLEHPKDFTAYTGETSWASTACALTTRGAFDEVGGFDSDTFFLYCDDVDYSWRLVLAGYRVLFEPAARVFHDKRLTPTGDWPPSPAEIYYSAEAALLLTHKYSRPELTASLRRQFAAQNTEPLRKALAEYEDRERSGRLPTPIDPGHRAASFVRDNYAEHRF